MNATRACLVLCVVLAVAACIGLPGCSVRQNAATATTQPPPQSPHGKLFAPVDLGLLEAPDRDRWQKPEQVMMALGIADGSVVGDLGAAGGWFTIRLARFVGPAGLVYAEDVQSQMIEAIERRVKREGLPNVRTVLGDTRDPHLPPHRLDAILIVETYHEMEDPVTLLRNAAGALKAQGRIGIIDYKKDGLGPGPSLEDRVDPATIERDANAAGLRLIERETFLPFQFFLIFGKQE
jgi:ubiquinone/menaquinone biosynthesis C-methylase UbiE